MANHDYEVHEHDVIVIGAGGAGLRAAIEVAAQGVSVGLVCKSLLGKAHTVMAEGGIAAALGNVWPEDNWQVHFRDTMRGGKMLNNWRMAQLHAQEAPERVLELERWGALFDRTKDGRILQRDFGGHRYARLAHVGDRTGLEMIRTLQYHGIHQGIDVYMECKVERLLKDGDRVTGAFGYWRNTGQFVLFKAKAVVLATGGIGKAWKITSNSWEYTGDGHAMALWAGADLIDMEFVQFHPTGMVWPPSVRGILVTEGVRGDGGTLKNTKGERFMFNYIPEFFKGETADNEAEADRWYADKKNNRRTPDLLPRDEVARAINAELYAKDFGGSRTVESSQVGSLAREMLEPFTRTGGENPYAIQADLQETMQTLVGLIRTEHELREALKRIESFKHRAARTHVDGGRTYNPGWHMALDLASLLTVAECCTLAALERRESRGGHTRDDHPDTDDSWGKINVVIRQRQGALALSREPLAEMPAELRALFQERK